jgi:membrane-bound lytic murein transglycosylase B
MIESFCLRSSDRRCTLGLALLVTLSLALPGEARTAPKSRKSSSSTHSQGLYKSRPQAMAFANEMAARHQLDPDWTRQLIGQARLNPRVKQLTAPAGAGFQKNWQVYRDRFIEPRRIDAAVRFWKTHHDLLARAEQTYGVPAAMVVGILGIETIYGRDTGKFSVLDALSTLAFDFPAEHPRASQRQAFFRDELEQFVLLTHRGVLPATVKGSYAGAMGWPQFMPSSLARYAVDFDGDGRIDLFHSVADIIGSVAHYFQRFGWHRAMPTHFESSLQEGQTPEDLAELLAPDIVPSFRASTLESKGVRLSESGRQHEGPLALVELRNGNAPSTYVAGTHNFYVLTRYNWSAYYAMAVIELGEQARQHLRNRPENPHTTQ